MRRQRIISCLYEPFKHWPAKGSVYIMSDLHFNDPDTKLMDPDWIDAEERIKNGLISGIPDIHRITIDRAIERPIRKGC